MKNEEFIGLIKALQERKLEALETIYRAYFLRIYTTAFFLVKSEQDAYDVAMNVLFKLVRYEGDSEAIRNHAGWLAELAKNEALDCLRKRRRVVLEDTLEREASPAFDTLWLTDVMRVLSEEEREIFTAHLVWDRNLKEIAEESGKPYIRIKRVYAEVKRKIQELYLEERKS